MEYIKQYSEEQLNQAYIQCYQEFQAKQQAEQEVGRAAENRTSSQSEDEFNSSNFKGQAAPNDDMFA